MAVISCKELISALKRLWPQFWTIKWELCQLHSMDSTAAPSKPLMSASIDLLMEKHMSTKFKTSGMEPTSHQLDSSRQATLVSRQHSFSKQPPTESNLHPLWMRAMYKFMMTELSTSILMLTFVRIKFLLVIWNLIPTTESGKEALMQVSPSTCLLFSIATNVATARTLL